MNTKIETMKFKNESEHTLNLEAIGGGIVEPGQVIEIPLHLCAPGRSDSGARKDSPIETVAPQLKPVDPSDHAEWRKVPPMPAPESRVVSINNNKRPSEAPGVAALRESLAAKKAQEATASTVTKETPKGAPKAGA